MADQKTAMQKLINIISLFLRQAKAVSVHLCVGQRQMQVFNSYLFNRFNQNGFLLIVQRVIRGVVHDMNVYMVNTTIIPMEVLNIKRMLFIIFRWASNENKQSFRIQQL